jgi:hypothetical protein
MRTELPRIRKFQRVVLTFFTEVDVTSKQKSLRFSKSLYKYIPTTISVPVVTKFFRDYANSITYMRNVF